MTVRVRGNDLVYPIDEETFESLTEKVLEQVRVLGLGFRVRFRVWVRVRVRV